MGRLIVRSSSVVVNLVVLAVMASPASASAGDISWSSTITGSADDSDWISAVALADDGAVLYVTGSIRTTYTFSDWVVAAYDAATGDELWRTPYDGPGHGGDSAYDLAVSKDGTRVVVTGRSSRTYIEDITTIAFDASTGDRIWLSRHKSRQFYGAGLAISVTLNRVFISGGVGGRARIIAMDVLTGDELWVSKGPTWSGAADIDVAGRRVFVSGSVTHYPDPGEAWVASYRAGTGAKLWGKHWSSGYRKGDGDFAWEIAATEDGTRVFTGVATSTSKTATVSYDGNTGKTLWRRLTSPGHLQYELNPSIALAPDGSTVVTTAARWVSGNPTFMTVAYSSDGTATWTAPSQETGLGEMGQPKDAVVSSDGSTVIVAGWGSPDSTGYPGFMFYAYDTELGGEPLWSGHTPDTSPFEYGGANAAAVAPDGSRLYLGGSSGRDAATRSYTTS